MTRRFISQVVGGLLSLTFVITLASVTADGATPVAVVIGNDHYANLPPDSQLSRARQDASAIADTLKRLGYNVVLRLDADATDMRQAIDTAAAEIQPGAATFVFFSGHGVEIDGANYLIPSDAPAPTADPTALTSHSVALSSIIDKLSGRGASANVIVLDACRSNPYGPHTRGGEGNRGLARLSAPQDGFFMIYSAGLNQTALDRLPSNDEDRDSVFTRVLLRYLPRTQLSLVDIAKGLQHDVSALAAGANHAQTPAYYDQLNGNYTLLGEPIRDNHNYIPAPAEPANSTVVSSISESSSSTQPSLEHEPTPVQDSTSALGVRVVGSRQAALDTIVRSLRGMYIGGPSARLTLDSDSGELRDQNDIIVFRFGHSTDARLYSAVLSKWSLANTISQMTNGMQMSFLPNSKQFLSGEHIAIKLSARNSGYVTGFDLASDGTISLLTPDPSSTSIRRTDRSGQFETSIDVTPPFGADQIVFIVSQSYPVELLSELKRIHGRAPNPSELDALLVTLSRHSDNLAMKSFYSSP